MKRLLLLLVPLVLADPAIAFDGGWHDKDEKLELSTDQSETLAQYSEFHQSCMDIQMTMWGEVAELMAPELGDNARQKALQVLDALATNGWWTSASDQTATAERSFPFNR